MLEIYFWQRIVSPHMLGLAVALAGSDAKVTYVAQERMSPARSRQGWLEPDAGAVEIKIICSKSAVKVLVGQVCDTSVHICQGMRANGLVGVAERVLRQRELAQWIVMETVDDRGWRGFLRRVDYGRIFRGWRSSLKGVLAIGHTTSKWVIDRGMPGDKVFPFSYFLSPHPVAVSPLVDTCRPFSFVFVGQFIGLKRLDLLLDALGSLVDSEFELVIIGSGPLEAVLRRKAGEQLGERVRWIGRLPSDRVQAELALADCLVLPSSHDGWGAVVSEALIVGTPVICSDACGSAGVVSLSGTGGVFASGDVHNLRHYLERAYNLRPIDKRRRDSLAQWAGCLTARAGAGYLLEILSYSDGKNIRPESPWSRLDRIGRSEKVSLRRD